MIDEWNRVQIVDVETATIVKEPVLPSAKPLAISEDGKFVLSVTSPNPSFNNAEYLTGLAEKLILSEIATGKTVQEFKFPSLDAWGFDVSKFNRNSFAVSPGGRFVACSPLNSKAQGVLYETKSGKARHSYPKPWGCTFSPDGAWFIYSSPDSIEFWDIAGGRFARPPIKDKSRILRCNADRSLLAGVRHDDITIWDLAADRSPVRMEVEVYEFPNSAAVFNHEGTEFLAAFNKSGFGIPGQVNC